MFRILTFFVLFFTKNIFAENSYYSSIKEKSGYKLKTELRLLIQSTHYMRSYSSLFDIYSTSDIDLTYNGDHSIVDMYSEFPGGIDPYNYYGSIGKCGQPGVPLSRKESDCYNREHLFPQSAFDYRSPMKSDFFHVYPSDGKVNNRRGKLSFGEVGKSTWVSLNGSKVGINKFEKLSNIVFEPIDEFKGDIARALLYFATRYENRMTSFHHEWLNHTNDQVYKGWFIRLLLKWHKQDPVSAHENQRNNIGFSFQGNRNPFIDHPEWVEKIWHKSKLE